MIVNMNDQEKSVKSDGKFACFILFSYLRNIVKQPIP